MALRFTVDYGLAGDIDAIHHRVHDACFIANSVKSEVHVEGAAEGPGE
jgi:organic hydroperoxide reductase OsmC/OhrA